MTGTGDAPRRSDITFFKDPDVDRAVGLTMELAAQLHVERQRRLALERLLEQQGVIEPGDTEALGDDEELLTRARTELQRSMQQLMRVITEDGPPEAPIRDEPPI
jgi:hypothetical protein